MFVGESRGRPPTPSGVECSLAANPSTLFRAVPTKNISPRWGEFLPYGHTAHGLAPGADLRSAGCRDLPGRARQGLEYRNEHAGRKTDLCVTGYSETL
jgi:hypothetical protein